MTLGLGESVRGKNADSSDPGSLVLAVAYMLCGSCKRAGAAYLVVLVADDLGAALWLRPLEAAGTLR